MTKEERKIDGRPGACAGNFFVLVLCCEEAREARFLWIRRCVCGCSGFRW